MNYRFRLKQKCLEINFNTFNFHFVYGTFCLFVYWTKKKVAITLWEISLH